MLKGIEQICSICTKPNCNMSTTKAFISCMQSVLVTVYSRLTFHIYSVTHYLLLLNLSDWQICGTYPAVHQHISHLHSFLLFAGCDQSKVSYVLLLEVLDFTARLDYILTQPGGSLLVVGAVEPEEGLFCGWWLIPQHCHNTPKIPKSHGTML